MIEYNKSDCRNSFNWAFLMALTLARTKTQVITKSSCPSAAEKICATA